MTSDTIAFFNALYADKPENATILIWSLQGNRKLSRWAKSIDEAARAVQAAEKIPGWNIYAGVCTGRQVGTANSRILAQDVYGIPGVWADIDIAGPGHKSKKLPPTQQSALEIIQRSGLDPTLIVNSGGGLHAYWLFKEYAVINTDTERSEYAALCVGWQKLQMMHAAAASYVIDGTHDLARVLRVPGTLNYKDVEPVMCRIIGNEGPRYEAEDIRSLLPATVESAAEQTATESFIIRDNVFPPQDKFNALCEVEKRFLDAWNLDRPDLNDDSASGYGASLATFAACAKWSDQEIVDLLVQHRIKHGFDPQLRHWKYYRNTIDLGRRAAARQQATATSTPPLVVVPIVNVQPDKSISKEDVEQRLIITEIQPPEKRALALDFLTAHLGTTIRSVKKYRGDTPQFQITTERGVIILSGMEKLLSQGHIRNAIADTDDVLIPPFKRDDWDAVAQSFLDAAEPIEVGTESTDTGSVREWLRIYLDENPPSEFSQQAVSNQMPFVRGDGTFFFLTHFRNWLLIRHSERIESKRLGPILRRVGAESSIVNYKPEDGKPTTRSVWKITE